VATLIIVIPAISTRKGYFIHTDGNVEMTASEGKVRGTSRGGTGVALSFDDIGYNAVSVGPGKWKAVSGKWSEGDRAMLSYGSGALAIAGGRDQTLVRNSSRAVMTACKGRAKTTASKGKATGTSSGGTGVAGSFDDSGYNVVSVGPGKGQAASGRWGGDGTGIGGLDRALLDVVADAREVLALTAEETAQFPLESLEEGPE
jgi:hypothetical protein